MRAALVALALVACKTPANEVCPIEEGSGPSVSTPTKIMQMVGDLDRETSPPTPTRARTESTVGLVGTDLGFSFLHKGKLWFLFGDTLPRDPSEQRPKDADSIAWSDDFLTSGGDDGFTLHFLTEPDAVDPSKTEFQPVRLDGHALGTVELPTTGFSAGDRMFVFFVVGGRGVLATSGDDGRTFQTLLRVPTAKLVNIVPLVLPTSEVPGADPSSAQTVLMYGRHASDGVFLAQAPLDRIGDASAWRFRTDAGWSASEADAAAQIAPSCGCNGNFSVTHIDGLDRWIMLNRCDGPHAILLRSSRSALGPWSAPVKFFDRTSDGGMCRFMHRACDPPVVACCDANLTASTQGHWGNGEDAYPYAPFPVAPYTRWDPATRTATIYFLMSVWNPYSPMLMRARLPASAVP